MPEGTSLTAINQVWEYIEQNPSSNVHCDLCPHRTFRYYRNSEGRVFCTSCIQQAREIYKRELVR